uniref:ShKT domain-containing protein n=1 Tax=Acrobeloides nanus TaxID=290746 RepID=A0A914DKN5_9BILA
MQIVQDEIKHQKPKLKKTLEKVARLIQRDPSTCSNPVPNTPNLSIATTQQPSQNYANIESDSNCNSWASTGICSSSLSQYCQKSCGLCSTTFLPLKTTKNHVLKPTKAQSINQCNNKDNDANCTYYAYLGFCKKASYASYMAQNL